jgi:ferredoxin
MAPVFLQQKLTKLNKMIQITIDNQQVEVPVGSTILDAAQKLGIEIPTLCFLKRYPPNTSCMVCVVKVNGRSKLLPACATKVEQSMHVESETDEVHQARQTALELLLSDHLGDCMGPCQVICPARMNIPLMIRQIAAGKLSDALVTVKNDIALPAVLGRICPAPCEKGCRRKEKDEAVAICLLKRYVADVDLALEQPYLPSSKNDTGKNVAIVGAGPAGLAAAYHLLRQGHDCTLFDEHEKPGGMLRYGVDEKHLPHDVLDAEISLIEKMGAQFRLNTKINTNPSLKDLQHDFDAVLLAVGPVKSDAVNNFNLPTSAHGLSADHHTFATDTPGLFVTGAAIRPTRLAVKALADGKSAAFSIDQYLNILKVTGPEKSFNCHIGKLKDGEIDTFMANINDSPRQQPSKEAPSERRGTDQPAPDVKSGDSLPPYEKVGFSSDQARIEALRCLHCDCRKPDNCKLRLYAHKYHARTNRFKDDRRTFEQQYQHPDLIYEPGKCIDCGICIQITAGAGEKFGLTFIGRGFDVRVKVPFNQSIADGLTKTAAQCAAACPTGALTLKENDLSFPRKRESNDPTSK